MIGVLSAEVDVRKLVAASCEGGHGGVRNASAAVEGDVDEVAVALREGNDDGAVDHEAGAVVVARFEVHRRDVVVAQVRQEVQGPVA